MSMPYWIISCDTCTNEWTSQSAWGDRLYRLSDGREARMEHTWGWCYGCDGFERLEKFLSREEISNRLKEAQDMFSIFMAEPEPRRRWLLRGRWRKEVKERQDGIQWRQRHVAEMETRTEVALAWRELRQSPPKCLACGSVKIDPAAIPKWGAGSLAFKHPGCGGALDMRESDIRLAMRPREYIYDVEGNLLREGYKTNS